jgi:hypothetical protein
MMDAETRSELLLRYLDGNLCPDEQAQVAELLQSDPKARTFLRDVAEHAVIFADIERAEQGRQAELATRRYGGGFRHNRPAGTKSSPASLIRWPLAVATVAVVMMMSSFFYFRTGGRTAIMEITGLNGATQWTGDGGQIDLDLETGQTLRGGTLESLSTNSWVELRFLDGSTVTISGPSVLTIAEGKQKELHLRRGSLSANIKPQQAGMPLLIHTPTAKLEVLGTQFNVDAKASTTLLTVNEGTVRVTRLADGRVKDVPADHQLTAAASLAEFDVSPRPGSVDRWKSNLPEDVNYGSWIPKTTSLRATPLLWRGCEETNQKPILLYVAAVLVSRGGNPPVALTSGAKFRIRGRMESPQSLLIGLTTQHPKGGFAGKYEVWLSGDDFRQDDDFFDVELPVEDFVPQKPELQVDDRWPGSHAPVAVSPIGLEVFDWWCLTINVDSGLTIRSVELIPADASPN